MNETLETHLLFYVVGATVFCKPILKNTNYSYRVW